MDPSYSTHIIKGSITNKKDKEVRKPVMILDYNTKKFGGELVNQRLSYVSFKQKDSQVGGKSFSTKNSEVSWGSPWAMKLCFVSRK